MANQTNRASYNEELPGFFRIGVPLPGNPLKELNAWLVKGNDRSLLVDTGFNMKASEEAILAALEKLEVRPDELDFFITHLHSDHNGLTHKLASPRSTIYSGRVDGKQINESIVDQEIWKAGMRGLASHGFPEELLNELFESHPGKIYASSVPLDFTWAEEGDTLEYGNYALTVVATPGHTPGHQVLREKNRHFLISGDHILGQITPNITAWAGVRDSLGDYLASLDKTDALDVEISYPGHRAVVENTHKRIEELRRHHEYRLAEAWGIVSGLGETNAWETAARMRWKLRGEWPEYHTTQKCFAVGEAVSHLDHLAARGELKKSRAEDGQIRYRSIH